MTTTGVGTMVGERRLLICFGPGGTGKTTTSAALALAAAHRGRRAVVLTIDPARRLADALGVGALGNTPTRVAAVGPGELWALQLDAAQTFDEVVGRWSTSPEQASRILANPYYRTIAGTLSGTQEYMAGEKLHELHAAGFDLVVVDTPPGRHAVDFLDASRRLVAFFDHRLYRSVLAPRHGALRALNLATQSFLRSAGRVVGTDVIGDAVDFFAAFEGMEDDFRQRSIEVQELLADAATGFVLVTTPAEDTLAAATPLLGALADGNVGRACDAVVVNRVAPRFSDTPPSADDAAADAATDPVRRALHANRAALHRQADRDERRVTALRSTVAPVPVTTVAALADDVHDLDGLAAVEAQLLA